MIEISSIGVLTAYVAGLDSFLSPCLVPPVPGAISCVTGRSPYGSHGESTIRLSVRGPNWRGLRGLRSS